MSNEARVFVVLNQTNNYISNVTLSSPLSYNYCKVLTNTQLLIQVSFLKTGYVFDSTSGGTSVNFQPLQGLVLAGSKFAYAISDKQINNFQVKIAQNLLDGQDEIQLIFYFFNSI